jgi:hypothetical protein
MKIVVAAAFTAIFAITERWCCVVTAVVLWCCNVLNDVPAFLL